MTEKLSASLKVVKLILILEPDIFNRNAALFQPVFTLLVSVYTMSSDNQHREAQHLLQNLLLNTGHFDDSLLEVNVLLNSLVAMGSQKSKELIEFLVTCFHQQKINLQVISNRISTSRHSITDVY